MVKFKKNLEADASADNSADSSADCSVDRKLQEIFGFTDEKLLAEFEAAERDTRSFPIPSPPANEFETIWTRIQEEAAAEKNNAPIIRVRFRWRRLAAVGLIACLVAGGSCMVALGRKSYFYRERTLDQGTGVLINDEYRKDVNGEEEAYEIIEKELGITPLRLGYMPAEMKFIGFVLRDGHARLEFSYRGESIFYIQSKYEKNVSYKIDADSKYNRIIYNKWIQQELKIEKEKKKNVDSPERYSASFVFDGSYFSIIGSMEESEFIKIIGRLVP